MNGVDNEKDVLVQRHHLTEDEVDRLLVENGEKEQFDVLMMYYDSAMVEVRTKLEVLYKEMTLLKRRNPYEYMKYRLKKSTSIYEKLATKGIPFTLENIEKHLNDIAGVRVVCAFIDDIYGIRDALAKQDDLEILQEKDYIASPKANGYRSLHIILRVPIFLSEEKKFMNVEVQFRTIAMDFWASVEHKMKYKKVIKNADSISEELKYSADMINQLDRRMLQIRDRIAESDNEIMEEEHTSRVTPITVL